MSGLIWEQETTAGIPLNEHVAHAGTIEAGRVMYDASQRMWIWSSRLADDAWGYGTSAEGAKAGFEAWLREWLRNFEGVLPRGPSAPDPS
ncbi:MAG: hypothetical protein AB7O56_01090 [Bauldia sp.]